MSAIIFFEKNNEKKTKIETVKYFLYDKTLSALNNLYHNYICIIKKI